MPPPRIILADDHAIVLDAFRKLLEPTYDVVATVTNGQALLAAARRLKPDLIVADIAMPQLNGLDACQQLKAMAPNVGLVLITANEDPEMAMEAIRRGASGYVLKKSASSELFDAIKQVLAGRHYITPCISKDPSAVFMARARKAHLSPTLTLRQREVLQLLAEGRSMKEAADILHVTPRTIAFHKYGMMEQLHVKTSAELVQCAMNMGLIMRKDSSPTA